MVKKETARINCVILERTQERRIRKIKLDNSRIWSFALTRKARTITSTLCRGHERVEFYLHYRICLHAVLRNNFTSTFNDVKPGNQSINVKLWKRREKWQSSKATSTRVRFFFFGKENSWNELYRHKALCHKPTIS